ncbi:17079_t:CDS:2, partial [Acaulospora colombiana]
LQRRLNEETKAWMRIDLTKVDKKVDVRWRAIRIPVPPRLDDSESYSEFSTHSHSRTNSWEEDVEALGGAGLARSDSMGRQSMFEGEEVVERRV